MKKRVIILVILVIALVLFGAIYYFFIKNNSDTQIQNIETEVSYEINESTPTVTNAPTPTKQEEEAVNKYLMHRDIYATMFWVGEKATEANDYIPNEASAWDSHWLESYGGIDNPYSRSGYYPLDFVPKENPFYFALPYNDFTESEKRNNAHLLPWSADENSSAIKNKWIKVTYKSNTCYGQWEDVGPFEMDDYDYVFGSAEPKNKRAGIDLSPAMRTCLKMATNDDVNWQFIDQENVPTGPWKEIITTSQVNW